MAHTETATVMGQPMAREEIFARLAEIARDNARHGLSDGRTTEATALAQGLADLAGRPSEVAWAIARQQRTETACPGCGSVNRHHFSVRVGDEIPARFTTCPNA